MPIVISRDGDMNLRTTEVSQEQRDALWYAFVTSWLEKNQEEFRDMAAQPAGQP